MTIRGLTFHPGVEHDLDAIVSYYRERDPALPARLRESFRRTLITYMTVYGVVDDRVEVSLWSA